MNDDIVKKYNEFMPKRPFGKLSNQMYVDGQLKSTFMMPSADFNMIVSFTPLKQIIIDISIDGIDASDSRLELDFKIGDQVINAQKWAESKGFKYKIIKRFN